jgi:hypothetical protein
MSQQFVELNQKLNEQFTKMQEFGKLFCSELTGQQIWDLYLAGFKPEQNPMFRDPESTEHNCNNDKNFIRRYGNIVAINPETLELISLFDIDVTGTVYEDTISNLSKVVKQAKVSEVFFETFTELNSLPYEKVNKNQPLFQLGHKETYKQYTKEEAEKFGVVRCDKTYKFDHFHVFLKNEFVNKTNKSIEQIRAEFRDNKNVFKRGLDEISLDTLVLVRDLIQQGSLLNGDAQLTKVVSFVSFKEQYNKLSSQQKDNWTWIHSYNLVTAKFRNELIGTLCVELTEGVDLNTACQTWNKRVDPANYMKAKAPITETQKKEARKFVEENGYSDSFDRTLVTLEDIKVTEILHSNIGDGTIKNVSIFDNIKTGTSTQHKRSQFDGIEEVGFEKFMKDILPTCTSVEVLFENRFEENLVALTTANNKESKPIFKWNNNYSWTYKNNLAGKSFIKENVQKAGGKVDGLLRCSLQWNDEDTKSVLDFDLHCVESTGGEIYYGNKKSYKTGGWLDVDMIRPSNIGIENITWQNKVPDGNYLFEVKNYDGGSNKGFKIEIEFKGEVFNYFYQQPVKPSQRVKVATVTVKNGEFTITHHLQETASSKTIWNLETNKFHKVKLACLSPNYWSDNNVGNKHVFFMLDNCKTDSPLRGFHNENLNNELLQHRKVIDVLGDVAMIQPTDNHLAGVGFNSTVRDEVILKLSGSHKRTIKVKF